MPPQQFELILRPRTPGPARTPHTADMNTANMNTGDMNTGDMNTGDINSAAHPSRPLRSLPPLSSSPAFPSLSPFPTLRSREPRLGNARGHKLVASTCRLEISPEAFRSDEDRGLKSGLTRIVCAGEAVFAPVFRAAKGIGRSARAFGRQFEPDGVMEVFVALLATVAFGLGWAALEQEGILQTGVRLPHLESSSAPSGIVAFTNDDRGFGNFGNFGARASLGIFSPESNAHSGLLALRREPSTFSPEAASLAARRGDQAVDPQASGEDAWTRLSEAQYAAVRGAIKSVTAVKPQTTQTPPTTRTQKALRETTPSPARADARGNSKP